MKEKADRFLESPGWMRLWKVVTAVWFGFLALLGIMMFNEGKQPGDTGSFTFILLFLASFPFLLYLCGKVVRWVIRGFLQ